MPARSKRTGNRLGSKDNLELATFAYEHCLEGAQLTRIARNLAREIHVVSPAFSELLDHIFNLQRTGVVALGDVLEMGEEVGL